MAFKASDNWSKYSKAMKSRGPVKKVVAVKKKTSSSPSGPAAPKVPEGMPAKPKTAFEEFCAQEENTGKSSEDLTAAFGELDAEKKTALEEKEKDSEAKYQEDLAAFNKTEEGAAYKKAVEEHQKKKKALEVKERLAKVSFEAPKKPEGYPEPPRRAFKIFCDEEAGSKTVSEMSRAWVAMDAEKKAEMEAKAMDAEKKAEME